MDIFIGILLTLSTLSFAAIVWFYRSVRAINDTMSDELAAVRATLDQVIAKHDDSVRAVVKETNIAIGDMSERLAKLESTSTALTMNLTGRPR